jgi:hypothetical protein
MIPWQGFSFVRALAAAALALVLLPVTAATAQEGVATHSTNTQHLKNLPYEQRNADGSPNFGTDLEFATIRGREYSVAGSYENGMHIVDITRPASARVAGKYDCDILQGDVQIFTQEQRPGRTFATYTADAFGNEDSACYREAEAIGFDAIDETRSPGARGKQGTFIADITSPSKPRTVSFVEIPQGSHNQTVHPSGDYLYNSNSDLITSFQPAIEVFDIRTLDRPKKIAEVALPPRPGLGTESHDITFNEEGTRGYSAALSQGIILDTDDPANPSVLTSFLDPAINVWHQSDPVTIGDREFLVVEDEFAGAAGGPVCPNGGVHIYEITGEMELDPQKVGYWNIDDARPTTTPDGRCTAHVFDIHEEEQLMTIAYYNGGVRVVDISGLEGISLGDTSLEGEGMRQLGFYRFDNSDTWAVKTPRIEPDGSFHMYGNDINRGFDVYRFTGAKDPSVPAGKMMTPMQAATHLQARDRPKLTAGNRMFCLLDSQR